MRRLNDPHLIRNRSLFDRPLIHIKAYESRSPNIKWFSGEHPRAGGPDRTKIAPRHLFGSGLGRFGARAAAVIERGMANRKTSPRPDGAVGLAGGLRLGSHSLIFDDDEVIQLLRAAADAISSTRHR
jgi:hypothetical protein